MENCTNVVGTTPQEKRSERELTRWKVVNISTDMVGYIVLTRFSLKRDKPGSKDEGSKGNKDKGEAKNEEAAVVPEGMNSQVQKVVMDDMFNMFEHWIEIERLRSSSPLLIFPFKSILWLTCGRTIVYLYHSGTSRPWSWQTTSRSMY
jgi:hypothetical protein